MSLLTYMASVPSRGIPNLSLLQEENMFSEARLRSKWHLLPIWCLCNTWGGEFGVEVL